MTVEGYLVAESGLHLGVGRAGELVGTELPVIRDTRGCPLIPGSSLKGALRGHLEVLVRGKAPPNADLSRFACDPTNGSGLCLDAKRTRALKEAYRDDDAGLAQAMAQELCLVCQTFGSPWWASPVRVRDLTVVADEWFGQFDVRDGVAIDRDKGTVAVGPYDYEVVPAGTGFALHIEAENLDAWQLGLLWLGLRALKNGDVSLGGFTSRGLGWVRLEVKDGGIRFFEGAQALLELMAGKEVGRDIHDNDARPWVDAFHTELRTRGARDA